MPAIHANIASGGPLLIATIGVSVPRMQAILAANAVVPNPITGTFLIDTGASGTCVDDTFISQLGLQPTGVVPIMTPSTGAGLHHCNQFDVSLFIPGNSTNAGGHLIPAIPIIATHLKNQGIDGLIGRDVIDNCTFIYNGTAKYFTLAY
jgi:aspartyl protease